MIKRSKMEEKEYMEAQLRNSIAEDLAQFTRLKQAYPELTDEELAHRMAMPEKQLKKVKKLLGD